MTSRIVVFSAHAADFCSRAGGTIAKASEQDCSVHVVDATFGERGESPRAWATVPPPNIEQVKETRRRECEAAARILGCTIEFLDFDDNPLIIGAKRKQVIFEIMLNHQPDVVLTHWLNEPFNPDHSTISTAVLDAAHHVECAGTSPGRTPLRYPSVFLYEPTVPFNDAVGFLPNHYVDITPVWEQKLTALKQLETQLRLVHDYTLYGQYRGFQARGFGRREEVKYAEAFVRWQPPVADLWNA